MSEWLRSLFGFRSTKEVIDARTTIALAREGAVTLRGRVIACEPTLVGLFVPGGAVLCRIELQRLEMPLPTSNSNQELPLQAGVDLKYSETTHVPFLLDDESGALAEIDLAGAAILSDRHEDLMSRPNAPELRIVGYARSKSVDPVDVLRVVVSSFLVGDTISVFGCARVLEENQEDSPYREARRPRLHVARPTDGELYASHDPLEELAETGRLNAAD